MELRRRCHWKRRLARRAGGPWGRQDNHLNRLPDQTSVARQVGPQTLLPEAYRGPAQAFDAPLRHAPEVRLEIPLVPVLGVIVCVSEVSDIRLIGLVLFGLIVSYQFVCRALGRRVHVAGDKYGA